MTADPVFFSMLKFCRVTSARVEKMFHCSWGVVHTSDAVSTTYRKKRLLPGSGIWEPSERFRVLARFAHPRTWNLFKQDCSWPTH